MDVSEDEKLKARRVQRVLYLVMAALIAVPLIILVFGMLSIRSSPA